MTDINPRTLTRIHNAARIGKEYRPARGVIQALHRDLRPILADLLPWAERAAEDCQLPAT